MVASEIALIEEIEKYLNSGIQIIYPKEDAILRVLHLLRKYKAIERSLSSLYLQSRRF